MPRKAILYLIIILLTGTIVFHHNHRPTVSGQSDDPITYQKVAELGRNGFTADVAWSPAGNLIATANQDGAWLYSAHSLWYQFHLPAGDVVRLAWSPDGTRLATRNRAERHNLIQVWDIRTREEVARIEQRNISDYDFAWSADGRYIVTPHHDMLRFFDAATGERVPTPPVANVDDLARELEDDAATPWPPEMESIVHASLSPDGERLAYSASNHRLHVWDFARGEVVLSQPHHFVSVPALTWSNTLLDIATPGVKGQVLVWDPNGGVLSFALESGLDAITALDGVLSTIELAAGDRRGGIALWNVRTEQLVFEVLDAHQGAVLDVEWNYQGNVLASASEDGTIQLHNGAGEHVMTLEGHGAAVYDVESSEDGSRLISGSENMTVNLWDVDAGTIIATYRDHQAPVTAVAWSYREEWVASGDEEGTVWVWNTTSDERYAFEAGYQSVVALEWYRDGVLIVGSEDGWVRVWDAASQELLTSFDTEGPLYSLSLNLPGNAIAVGGRVVSLWTDGQFFNTYLEEEPFPVYIAHGLMNVSWTQDSQSLYFRDYNGFDREENSWARYDVPSHRLTRFERYPALPLLSPEEEDRFEPQEGSTMYTSPDGRYLAYATRMPDSVGWSMLALADRFSSQTIPLPDHYIIVNPYSGPDEFRVIWSANGEALTYTLRSKVGNPFSKYITGYATDTETVRVQEWTSFWIGSQEYLYSTVHAVSDDGMRVLLESNLIDHRADFWITDDTHLILWDSRSTTNGAPLTAIDTSHLIAATFHPTAPDKLLLVNERGLVEYDIHSRRMTVLNPAYHSGLGDYGLFSPDRAWLAIVEDGLEEGNYPPRLYVFDVRASLSAAE